MFLSSKRKCSYLPVSMRIGATPHLNLLYADLCCVGKISLQYSSVRTLVLKVQYVLNLLRPLPDVPVTLVIEEDHPVTYFTISRFFYTCLYKCVFRDKLQNSTKLWSAKCFLTK